MEEEGGSDDPEVQNVRAERLKDRLRLSLVDIAESQAQKCQMSISPPVMNALADVTYKFAEQLARDLEMFAQHAGRKCINVDDVLLAARRNEDVVGPLKAAAKDLSKEKEQQLEKKRRKVVPKAD